MLLLRAGWWQPQHVVPAACPNANRAHTCKLIELCQGDLLSVTHLLRSTSSSLSASTSNWDLTSSNSRWASALSPCAPFSLSAAACRCPACQLHCCHSCRHLCLVKSFIWLLIS